MANTLTIFSLLLYDLAQLSSLVGKIYSLCVPSFDIFYNITRLASVNILRNKREPGVGKLGWHGNFDAEFERNTVISFKIPILNFFTIVLKLLFLYNLQPVMVGMCISFTIFIINDN